jgi:hypothetical protein
MLFRWVDCSDLHLHGDGHKIAVVESKGLPRLQVVNKFVGAMLL